MFCGTSFTSPDSSGPCCAAASSCLPWGRGAGPWMPGFLAGRPGRTLLSSDPASFKALRSLHAWIRRLRVLWGNKAEGSDVEGGVTTPTLGRHGAYLLVQDYEKRSLASRVKSLEDLGYGTIWIAGNAPGDLAIPEAFLAETTSVAVGTAIVNVWSDAADQVAEAFHRVDDRHPGRF